MACAAAAAIAALVISVKNHASDARPAEKPPPTGPLLVRPAPAQLPGPVEEAPPFALEDTPARAELVRRFEELDVLRTHGEPAEVVAGYRQLHPDTLREYGPGAYEPYAVLDRLAGFYSDHSQIAEGKVIVAGAQPPGARREFLKATRATRDEIIAALRRSDVVAWRKLGEIAKHEVLIHLAEGRLDEARPRMDRAAALFADHPLAAGYSYSLVLLAQAKIAAGQGRWDDAEEASDRQFRLRHRLDARPLDQLSLEVLEHADSLSAYHLAYSIGRRRAELPGKAARFAEWNLNAKVFRRETFARQLTALIAARGGRAAEVRGRLLDAWGRLAALAVEPARGPSTRAATDRRFAALRPDFAEVKALAREAARATSPPAEDRDSWVSIDRVREALPPDAVLIDLVAHLDYDFDAPPGSMTWKGAREIAFIIPPAGRGEVRLVDLGDEELIWEAINTYLLEFGPDDDDAEAARVSRGVARVLLDPMMPHVGNARRWVVSPYGLSWLVPWSTLVLDDGSLAVERYAISYVMAGRHVLDRAPYGPAPAAAPGAPLIVADPDYDLDLPEAERGQGPFLPLPGTVGEARAIAPHLEAYAKARPRILRGAEARERALRDGPPPTVLVASTHGYYGGLPDVRIGVRSAMLSCGLAFAGANARRATPARPGDDGIATGLEILATDFRGTDLVVPSACQSSFCEFQATQGLVGLNLAFHLAGVRTVLGALWPVPVDETTVVTTEFFAELARGTPKDEALRRAQVKLIGQLRAKHSVAHPSLWAGFLLSGDALPTRP